MGAMKEHFILTNEQVGWIAGAALWGFTISIFIFGPLCDALGMKFLLRLAFLGHVLGETARELCLGFGRGQGRGGIGRLRGTCHCQQRNGQHVCEFDLFHKIMN